MIKALLLIFEPMATWEGIFRARRSFARVMVTYLLPMLLLASAAEGFGLAHWGKWQSDVGRLKHFRNGEVLILETIQFLLALVIVFSGAHLIKSIGETFHGRHNYTQTFTTVAYGLSPLFLLRLLDAFSGITPWATWSIGIILSIAVLYQGVPRMMEPDPPHAFGLFLISSLLLALITGLVRFVTWCYLEGKFGKLEAIISDLATRLP